MADQNDLKERRIRVYSYIKHLFKSVIWVDADLTKDNDLASVLDVTLSDLTLLGEGEISPSPKLVESVKVFFKNDPNPTLPRQIEHVLIDPFT